MVRAGFAFLLALMVVGLAPGAVAQSGYPPDEVDGWTIDTSKAKLVPKKKAAVPRTTPASSPEEADRAARLAQARKRFFDNAPADKTPEAIHDFGGYDSTRDSGTLKPGATFKF